MRGRKPEATAVKKLKGFPGKRKRNTKEPVPTTGSLFQTPPGFNDYQAAEWQFIIANAPPGVLYRIDRSVLAAYVVAVCLHRKAMVAFNAKDSLLEASPKQGVLMQSALIPIINKQAALIVKLASELGFSPASRTRIEAGDPPPVPGNHEGDDARAGQSGDEFDRYLEKSTRPTQH